MSKNKYIDQRPLYYEKTSVLLPQLVMIYKFCASLECLVVTKCIQSFPTQQCPKVSSRVIYFDQELTLLQFFILDAWGFYKGHG